MKYLLPYLQLMRPHQWTKNVFCLAGVLFGKDRLCNHAAWKQSILLFVGFSLLSSIIYIFNDLIDKDKDKLHPKKCKRPIASGEINLKGALLLIFLLIASEYFLIRHFPLSVHLCLAAYVFNNLFYSFYLKHLILLDAFSISFGFLLRLFSGIYILGDTPTEWIALCTLSLSLFLCFAKRYSEFKIIPNEQQRKVTRNYNESLLLYVINATATMTIIFYAIFSVESGKNSSLLLTVPIVFYAISYYRHLLFTSIESAEEPEKMILNKHIIASALIWVISYLSILYLNIQLFK